MKILNAGDFCQKYRVDTAIKEKRFGELFDEIKPIIESADYSIVNFEFPIVTDPKKAKPIPKCGPNLKGTVESVDAVKYAGFDCCTLANNHTLDQGDVCGMETKNLLESAGLDTVGFGKDLNEADTILYKEIAGETLAIINCCEHEFSIATESTPGTNPLNPIQQYYKIQEAKQKANYVLVIVHGGHEMYQLPSPRMQETYRFFVDAGADAVVNHHQHVYSGYEVYNGKPIFYGLGNFCFDHVKHRNNTWNEGYMVNIEFGESIDFTLIPYTQGNSFPCVKLMDSEKKREFDTHVLNLNKITSNQLLLEEEYTKWVLRSSRNYLIDLMPYSGRILKGLALHGYLPRIPSQRRIISLFNKVQCESHRDRLIKIAKSYI